MAFITVIALYDGSKTFYPDGKTFSINTAAKVIGVFDLPIVPPIPGSTDPLITAPLLLVKTVEYGELSLNMSLDDYIAAVAAASGGGASLEQTYTFPPDEGDGSGSFVAPGGSWLLGLAATSTVDADELDLGTKSTLHDFTVINISDADQYSSVSYLYYFQEDTTLYASANEGEVTLKILIYKTP